MFLKLWPCVILVVCLVFGNQLEAQTDRYELGRRVKRYEVAWQSAEKVARDRSTESMQRAVSYFFGLNFQKAGQALDSALLKIKSSQPASEISKWTVSRKVTVQKRVTDAAANELQISIGEFYETKTSAPEKAKVNVVIYGDTGQVLLERTDLLANLKTVNSISKLADPQLTCRWKPGQIGEGDFKVSVNLLIGESSHRIDEFLYSRVTDLDKRLDLQNERIKTAKATATPTGYQTLKMWRDLARDSYREERLEIDYPVHRLTKNFDSLCDHGGEIAKFLEASTQREFWITLRAERKQVPMRIRLPKDLSTPRPLLFVFHGAGGSDNMFFETYGAGRCVDLAEERGWIVVSPNQGLLSRLSLDCRQMVELLSKHIPVDQQQIMYLGHSMGAAQVITQVKANPELPIAAVALGGGRGQRDAKPLSSTPWFVAAGEQDFGRRGARSLFDSLKSEDADVTYKVYPNVEHLVIVQAALDDAFKFLDRVIASDVK
ncbi:MAG: putative esterase [Mariniblastus sp.]|jgi:predicted esterase